MSDLMLLGVLRMPLTMVESDPLTLIQFVGRAHEAATRIESDAKLIEQLRAQLQEAMVRPVDVDASATPATAASVPKSPGQLHEEIEQVLLHYKLDNWVDQHDSPLGLVDRLCDHDARDIGSGRHQIRLIVDTIYNEVLTKPESISTTSKADR